MLELALDGQRLQQCRVSGGLRLALIRRNQRYRHGNNVSDKK